MRFANLVWKNVLRSRRRTILTVLSLAASLFLLTTLRTVLYEMQEGGISQAPEVDLRLWTRHAVSLGNAMPIAYLERILKVPGVRDAMPTNWFGGIYIDEKNFFGQFAVDPEKEFAIFPELQMPAEQKEAFRRERNAAIAGRRLFQRFGWKIGDRITLKGTIYPVDPEFVLVGQFTSPNPPDEASFLFRWDYLDELTGRRGHAGTFAMLAASREDVPRVMEAVDSMFRNSTAPTKTETEKAFQLSFSGMMGNLKLLVGSISAVVVFTILLVTAATMSMSIRERTAEFGVLKALGYTRGLIIGLLVGESLIIALTGWLLGCVGARLLFRAIDLQNATGGWLVQLRVQPDSLLLGLALAILVGVVTASFPAYRASRLSVAEALRHVG